MRALSLTLLLVACTRSADATRIDSASANKLSPAEGSSSATTSVSATTNSIALAAQKPSKVSSGDFGPRTACQIISVHDGDTFRCKGDVRVRLLLVDAPEIDQPDGPPARDALRKLLPRAAVAWLEFDVQRTDKYGRTLAYAWSAERGGVLLNKKMAEDGWVAPVVFPPNVRRIEEIRSAVTQARNAKRGIWKATTVCQPIDHKKKRC